MYDSQPLTPFIRAQDPFSASYADLYKHRVRRSLRHYQEARQNSCVRVQQRMASAATTAMPMTVETTVATVVKMIWEGFEGVPLGSLGCVGVWYSDLR